MYRQALCPSHVLCDVLCRVQNQPFAPVQRQGLQACVEHEEHIRPRCRPLGIHRAHVCRVPFLVDGVHVARGLLRNGHLHVVSEQELGDDLRK